MDADEPRSASSQWRDEDLILISAIEHWSYCPRQCALIQLEQTYDENIYTLRGSRSHERVHSESAGTEDGVRVTRGLPLWSERLGLIGKSDLVEWHGDAPYPVEYKVGKRRTWAHEALQLCAQALCLAEMLERPVPAGAVYYVGSKRRREVTFGAADIADIADIAAVEAAVTAIRSMLRDERLPLAVNDARCPNCSLIDACAPGLSSRPAVIRGHYAELFHPAD